ncbi:threonine aldolase [Phaffia rhodozyma]|uniref:Threonine aldolase n=1 Tax=Phaffia rhodozyma TaxID=264483 RepID=A0A0F7STW1_PHARH|nr:threonine aldolase [Phaffia rhodozyma]
MIMDPYAITANVGGQANVEKLKAVQRDFRTDTITIPSDAMLQVGMQATRGDDVYNECATTAALEARVAKLCGKEAGLFVVSGTMSNQLGLRAWLTQPPHSVLLDFRSHVFQYEAGGLAFHSQASPLPLKPWNGHHLTWDDDIADDLILGDNIHCASTKIICLENTLNGTIFPQDEIVKISKKAKEEGLIMHCDGARLWNVAAEKGATMETLPEVMKELCDPFDSVSVCLSKGLGAPIGSVLVGPAALIKKAIHFRKLFGGGIRQSGAIAAAADFALTHNFERLRDSHKLAKRLSAGLKELGVQILYEAETCMVFVNFLPLNLPMNAVIARAAALPNPIAFNGARLVCHYQLDPQAVEDFIELVRVMKDEEVSKGWVPEIPRVNGATEITRLRGRDKNYNTAIKH